MAHLEAVLKDLTSALKDDIWSAAEPPEAAAVLLASYGGLKNAAEEAFKREIEAWQNDQFGRAIFWSCVLDLLTPFNIPLRH